MMSPSRVLLRAFFSPSTQLGSPARSYGMGLLVGVSCCSTVQEKKPSPCIPTDMGVPQSLQLLPGSIIDKCNPQTLCHAHERFFFPLFHHPSRTTSFSSYWVAPPIYQVNIELKIILRARLSSLGPSRDRALCLNSARLTSRPFTGAQGPREAYQ